MLIALITVFLLVYFFHLRFKIALNPLRIESRKTEKAKEKFIDFIGQTLITILGFAISVYLLSIEFAESEKDARRIESNLLLIIQQEFHKQNSELHRLFRQISKARDYIDSTSQKLSNPNLKDILWSQNIPNFLLGSLPYVQSEPRHLDSFIFDGSKYIQPAWFWYYLKSVNDSLQYYQGQVSIHQSFANEYLELIKQGAVHQSYSLKSDSILVSVHIKYLQIQLINFADMFYRDYPRFLTQVDTLNEVIRCRITKIGEDFPTLERDVNDLDKYFADEERIKWKIRKGQE